MSETLNKADLAKVGVDIDNIVPGNIPENISPVLKSQLLDEWRKQQEKAGVKIGIMDLPTPSERANERVRMEAEGGKPLLDQGQNQAANKK